MLINFSQRRRKTKAKRVSEAQIVAILKQQQTGLTVAQIIRQHGISEVTFYNWKSKYGSMQVADLKRLKDLEEDNGRIKKMYAELSLENEVIKEAFQKSGMTC
ncbi:transposase [Spirosoma lacussanchae]|uniref:transposase n=1 Tax=Spirosoma lacussanchae TaxID=1884249 RepID=UPI001109079A|nr:transposase [Spirosoma lacussanchae]